MAIPIVACGTLAFLSAGLLLGIAAVLTAISARVFRWDQI